MHLCVSMCDKKEIKNDLLLPTMVNGLLAISNTLMV